MIYIYIHISSYIFTFNCNLHSIDGCIVYHLIDDMPRGGQISRGVVIKENTELMDDDDANEAKAVKLKQNRSQVNFIRIAKSTCKVSCKYYYIYDLRYNI